ncbi:MAG TPA: RrF2 family transcriptional regulator [Deltaproteobacteria bacterium]|nr:RrF2 family transcriptional regulator [Deltaproteobacteria bacterium]HQB39014.1 RrF2 family transcriptional regulator [Deltaproteobacteria bacterium]
MRLTTKSRYGLRAMFDIAYQCGSFPAQIQDISRRQQISPRYLEQIFQHLKQAGILKSKRGPQGGYCLARKPSQITLLEIINATEQDIKMVDCVTSGQGGSPKEECSLKSRCVTQTIWEEAGNLLNSYFGSLTLQHLCERGQALGIAKEETHRFMYYI